MSDYTLIGQLEFSAQEVADYINQYGQHFIDEDGLSANVEDIRDALKSGATVAYFPVIYEMECNGSVQVEDMLEFNSGYPEPVNKDEYFVIRIDYSISHEDLQELVEEVDHPEIVVDFWDDDIEIEAALYSLIGHDYIDIEDYMDILN